MFSLSVFPHSLTSHWIVGQWLHAANVLIPWKLKTVNNYVISTCSAWTVWKDHCVFWTPVMTVRQCHWNLEPDSESNLMQMQQLTQLPSTKFPCITTTDRCRSRESESVSKHMDDSGGTHSLFEIHDSETHVFHVLHPIFLPFPGLITTQQLNCHIQLWPQKHLKTSLDLPLSAHTCNWQTLN